MDFSILNQRPLFFDGATGTMLLKFGLQPGAMGEAFNIERPNTVLRLHKSYLRAGADIIKTNTFSANKFKKDAIGYSVADTVLQGVTLARRAVSEAKRGLVALDIGPLGMLLEPLGKLSFEEAVETFSEIIKAGYEQSDIILIETMSDLHELKAAVIAAKETCELPIFTTCTFDENGKMLCGAGPEEFVSLAESLGVSALGINCGCGPERAAELIKKFEKITSVPLIANPNAGLPVIEGSETHYNLMPKEFGYAMEEIVKAGAQIIGGCCGTTPDHISSAYSECCHSIPKRVTDKNLTVASTCQKTVYIGNKPAIVGERLNPTGKAKLKAALRSRDFDYITNEALLQENAGADILDINVGMPDIDEKALICEVIRKVQKVCRLPLQIDTADGAAMEAALRAYNGKPIINSVNGSKQSLFTVIPLVKKYGGVLICLTLDEKGIPETVEGRLKIASRIIKVADACGIARKNLIFDTLTMTVATDPKAAKVTLDSMVQIKEQFGVNTILGVSNISFGFPQRDIITAGFLSQALAKGLSAAIVNPVCAEVRKAITVYNAVNGYDNNFEKYSAMINGTDEIKTATTLSEAIEKGVSEKAREFASKLLETVPPTEIISSEIIPALGKVGEAFESGKIFLPELLTAASASEAAFEVIKNHMDKSGEKTESKGTVVLATVKGDIHDLGKNIVKALLSNFGYKVIDLGKDVPAEKIAELAKNLEIKLVGLSALMTTTAPAISETVTLIKKLAPDCKIMVGGAVITEEYAKKSGADFYAKDAVAAVKIADGVFAK